MTSAAATPLPSAEVRAWLAERWDPVMPSRQWNEVVVDAGWAAPRYPVEWYGRGYPGDLAKVVEAEFRAAGAPGSGQDVFNLWATTVLAWGTDDLKSRFVRPLLLGEIAMCLLYSEPGAGSDLASLATTAVRDGDEWVVNGQKVWTSGGRHAHYGMLIARTDWDVPKHRGITFFFLPMRQPGVEVRPLRQITGDSRFNEVFLTDARVPDANRVGPVGHGWRVLQTALAAERAVMGVAMSRRAERPAIERTPPTEREPDSEWDIPAPDLALLDVARRTGRDRDPVVRQRLARLHALRTVNDWNGRRARAEMAQGSSSPVASLGKLAMSRLLHEAGHLHTLLLGAEATTNASGSEAADANYSHLNAYFFSIGGGTDQIQRNIIGERILGLPREPEPERDVPFREVRRGAQSPQARAL